ncbi:hypothetical protein ACFPRL_21020 [Pseudoclavibacter helvolus]
MEQRRAAAAIAWPLATRSSTSWSSPAKSRADRFRWSWSSAFHHPGST